MCNWRVCPEHSTHTGPLSVSLPSLLLRLSGAVLIVVTGGNELSRVEAEGEGEERRGEERRGEEIAN